MSKQLRLYKIIDGVRHQVVLTVDDAMTIEKEEITPLVTVASDARLNSLRSAGIEFHEENGAIHIDRVPPETQQILRFFSPNTPCWFPGCAELREQYEKELQQLKANCPPCEKGAILRKYSDIVRKQLFGDDNTQVCHTGSGEVSGPGTPAQ